MDPNVTFFRPQSDNDWEQLRKVFTALYIQENRPLTQVMKIMEDRHRVRASEKMYKTRIKAWNLRKNLKKDEAEQVVAGEILPSEAASHVLALTGNPDKVAKRAARTLKRKRDLERGQTHSSPAPVEPATPPSPPTETIDAIVPWTPPPQEPIGVPQAVRFSGIAEQFLFGLRAWTHDAFVSGNWDSKLSKRHHGGRQASRLLSSDLTAGTNLFDKGKQQLAWAYWKRAVSRLDCPELFQTWYHETPIRLLFEVSRLAHNGHYPLAASFLKSIRNWAATFLKEGDSRHTLFSLFAELDVAQLKDLYVRAALCLYKGLESRVEKQNPLLYEVRLNRALDILWYDPESDLTEWLSPISEVDQACGPDNPYSVYFLLLEAYRLVAQGLHSQADQVCLLVRDRLSEMKEGSIDSWRVGLAYRRLGRLQQSKGRYSDARRNLNTALRYVGIDTPLSASIWVEIAQCQESMAKDLDDQEDAALWSQMLQRLEQQITEPEEIRPVQQLQPPQPAPPRLLTSGNEAFVSNKRRRISPSPTRSMTL